MENLRNKIAELEVAKKQLQDYSQNLEKIVAERTSDLSEANKKLSGIINYCADGIIIVDSEGKILQVNPACENMVGLSESALCKKKIQEIAYSNVKELNSSKDNKSGEIFGLSDENSEILLRDYFVVNALSGIHTRTYRLYVLSS